MNSFDFITGRKIRQKNVDFVKVLYFGRPLCKLAVSEKYNRKIWIFSSNGEFIHTIDCGIDQSITKWNEQTIIYVKINTLFFHSIKKPDCVLTTFEFSRKGNKSNRIISIHKINDELLLVAFGKKSISMLSLKKGRTIKEIQLKDQVIPSNNSSCFQSSILFEDCFYMNFHEPHISIYNYKEHEIKFLFPVTFSKYHMGGLKKLIVCVYQNQKQNHEKDNDKDTNERKIEEYLICISEGEILFFCLGNSVCNIPKITNVESMKKEVNDLKIGKIKIENSGSYTCVALIGSKKCPRYLCAGSSEGKIYMYDFRYILKRFVNRRYSSLVICENRSLVILSIHNKRKMEDLQIVIGSNDLVGDICFITTSNKTKEGKDFGVVRITGLVGEFKVDVRSGVNKFWEKDVIERRNFLINDVKRYAFKEIDEKKMFVKISLYNKSLENIFKSLVI